MLFFTADQHYGHRNIIKHCDRPFISVEEMDRELIRRHNEVVGKNDTVIHAGDFTLASKDKAGVYILALNGKHRFLLGSHDRWLNGKAPTMRVEKIEGQKIVICHYAMLVWPFSHYNSWHLFGHSHGKLNDKIEGKAHDIGVDNNDFYPVSLDQIRVIMESRPDNFNLVARLRKGA